MAIGALESNLDTQDDYYVVQLYEMEPQQFYISDLTQQAITKSISKFKLIKLYGTSILVKFWPIKVWITKVQKKGEILWRALCTSTFF